MSMWLLRCMLACCLVFAHVVGALFQLALHGAETHKLHRGAGHLRDPGSCCRRVTREAGILYRSPPEMLEQKLKHAEAVRAGRKANYTHNPDVSMTQRHLEVDCSLRIPHHTGRAGD